MPEYPSSGIEEDNGMMKFFHIINGNENMIQFSGSELVMATQRSSVRNHHSEGKGEQCSSSGRLDTKVIKYVVNGLQVDDRVTDYFNRNCIVYDKWFEMHSREYNEQLEFLKTIIPKGRGIEIGVGTGRFAGPLGIEFGLDSAPNMLKLAKERGVKTIIGSAYNTKLPDKEFDFSLLYVTLCFLENPEKAIREAFRISRIVISVILDRESTYVQNIMKDSRGFYQLANFYTGRDVVDMYRAAGLKVTWYVERELRTSDGTPYKLVGILGSK